MTLPTLKSWRSLVQYLLRYLVWYVNFCRLVPKGTETPSEIFGASGPIYTKIAQNIAAIVLVITSKAKLRYMNPFWNASMLNQGHFANLSKIGCHGNVPKGIKKKSGLRKFTQIPFISWKQREHRSSRSWDNLSQVKKKKLRKVKYIARSASLPSGLKKNKEKKHLQNT